jgi:hypothetical protein
VVVKTWRKLGGGSFYLGDRKIVTGERFTASESEIPLGFRDVVEEVGGRAPDSPVIKGKKSEFKLVVSEDGDDLYDIVDLNGKKMNEKPLSVNDAADFKRDLEG